jgi:hypothetical protein
MEADTHNCFLSYFEYLKIDFGSIYPGSKMPKIPLCIGPLVSKLQNANPIFRHPKIADEKLQSISFHNHLVARCNVENRCIEAPLNTTLRGGGLMTSVAVTARGRGARSLPETPLDAATCPHFHPQRNRISELSAARIFYF